MKSYTQEKLSKLVKDKLLDFDAYAKKDPVMFISYEDLQNLAKTNLTVAKYIEKNIGKIDKTKYSREYLENSLIAIQKSDKKIDIYPVPKKTFENNYKRKNGDIDPKNKLTLFHLLIEAEVEKLKETHPKEKKSNMIKIRELKRNYNKLKNENRENLLDKLDKLDNLIKPLAKNIQVAVKEGVIFAKKANEIFDFNGKDEVEIVAPWGETQKVKPNDFITYNYKTQEIYKIEGDGSRPNGYVNHNSLKYRDIINNMKKMFDNMDSNIREISREIKKGNLSLSF